MFFSLNKNSRLFFCKVAKRLFIFFLISVVCCLSAAVANRAKIQLATVTDYDGGGSGDALPSEAHRITLKGNASIAPTETPTVSTISSITADELREKIREIIGKIPEFVGIQELSVKLHGIALTDCMTLPSPVAWHYPHQLHGITLTSCMALPAPVAWHCPHQLHGIARTSCMALPALIGMTDSP